MKKNILGLAAITLLLMACSQDDNQNPTDNTLVAIEIGTKSPEINAQLSRAAITESDWAGTQNIGIYGLSNTANDWLTGEDACILENINVSVGSDSENKLVLGQTYYYPIGSTQPYTFYGYYPYQNNITVGSNSLEVPVTITGEEDLLWGIAKAENQSTLGYDGFNSRYMRDGGDTPHMEFEHVLTRFTFTARDATVPAGTGTLKINSIKIVNAKNTATLLVATNDEDLKDDEGTLVDAEGDAEFILKDENGVEVEDIVLSKGSTFEGIGESIMVIPNEVSYNLVIEVELDGDPNTRTERNMEIKRQGENAGKAFEAGDSHEVQLTVYGPTEIEITTKLKDWDEKEEIPLVID